MNIFKRLQKSLPLVRAIGVFGAVGIVSSMATFATLQTTGHAFTGNIISTAASSLQVSLSGDNGTWHDSLPGFTFSGLVPGGSASSEKDLFVKNTSTSVVALTLSVPSTPTVSGSVDFSKVYLWITPTNVSNRVSGSAQKIALSSLISSPVNLDGSSLVYGQAVEFGIRVTMDAGAVTSGGATISNLDLSFNTQS